MPLISRMPGLLGLGLMVATLVSCGGPPVPAVVPSGPSGPAVFELLEITPEPGAALDSTLVLRARLRYRVLDSISFPGPYTANVTFRTESGSFRPATPAERDGPKTLTLLASSGTTEIEYPLSLVLNRPEFEFTDPLTAIFSFGRLEAVEDEVPVAVGLSERAILRGPRVIVARRISVVYQRSRIGILNE